MDVGFSVAGDIPGLGGRVLVDAIVERAGAADEAGLASLHVGDRHRVPEPHAANLALAARLAARWNRRLGVLVISSMWNPVLLAEQLATLSTFTPQLDVVMALGHGEDQFAGMGIPFADRVELFTEGIEVTRSLLAGETVTAVVGPHDISGAHVEMRGDSEINWLVAATAPAAIRRAAHLGAGWLASAKLPVSDAISALQLYRDAGGAGRAVIRRDVFVGSSGAEVTQLAEPVVAAGHRGYPPEAILRGTTIQVREYIGQLGDAGFDELLARSLVPTQNAALASIGRLGEAALDAI